MDLTAEELRVLCVLVEKSFTTPEQYPLTTNALVTGCNQRTSRDPVVAYSTSEVDGVMQSLRTTGWARTVRMTGSRTNKHKHVVAEKLPINDSQLALLAVLGLRGPQSPGELKTRTERYVGFESFGEVVDELESMAVMEIPLVRNIGTRPGQSQDRWVQLVGPTADELSDGQSGPPRQVDASDHVSVDVAPEATSAQSHTALDRPILDGGPSEEPTVTSLSQAVDRLERRVAELEDALAKLRRQPDPAD